MDPPALVGNRPTSYKNVNDEEETLVSDKEGPICDHIKGTIVRSVAETDSSIKLQTVAFDFFPSTPNILFN